MQAFREKNQQLFNIALVQQANIKKLADQIATGILSPDEINLQQAKINAALLHLSDEHARLFEDGVRGTIAPRWMLWAGVALVALALIGWLVQRGASTTDQPDFDLTVYLHEPDGEHLVINKGSVNLRLGETVLPYPQQLDFAGKATFKGVDGTYQDSVVALQYFPLQKERRFKITHQTVERLSGRKQDITFTLEFLPDTTVFQASLTDAKHKSISGAEITIDGNLHAVSDSAGYFSVDIPKPIGTMVYLVIKKNGKLLYKQDMPVTSDFQEIPIE